MSIKRACLYKGEEKFMAIFGKAFRNARTDKKLTLREVGEYIKKSIGYLADIEHGRKLPPDLETVSKIEDLLEIRDGSLIHLAREERKTSSRHLSQKLKTDHVLTSILCRAEKLSDDKKKELLKTITKMEEK